MWCTPLTQSMLPRMSTGQGTSASTPSAILPTQSPLPPHPLLTDYYGDVAGKRKYLKSIFDAGAKDYDRVESLLSFGSGRWYRREALRRAGMKPGMQVLDVASGTGLVAREAIALVKGESSAEGGG